MTFTFNEVSVTTSDEVNMSSSDRKFPMEQDETEDLVAQLSEPSIDREIEEEEEEESDRSSSDESNRSNNSQQKSPNHRKARSVSFAPVVEEYEIPSRYDPSYVSPCQPTDYLDALVESYKLQTLTTLYPFHYQEEKKYVPKTTHTRLTPNWREHRIRHLMNRLEELSLWDREEELKISQAEFLRAQKFEQIQDRQRNHDLCLKLMRQRHESEMESAILLDRTISSVNDENTAANIARAMSSTSPLLNRTSYDVSTKSSAFKRRQNDVPICKTPTGRYRQFETNMDNKLELINRTCQIDRDKTQTYASYRASSLPPTVVPLFSETYATLLSIPNRYSSNRYRSNRDSHEHASSPDYERLVRAHSNRDVRVPLKEDSDDNDEEIDHNSRFHLNSSRDYSFIHSPQPKSPKIHQRSLNDDLNAITQSSLETNKSVLRNLTNYRSSSEPRDNDTNDNLNYYSTSKMRPFLLTR